MLNLIWTFLIEVFGKQALVNFFKRNKTIAFLCFTNTILLVLFLAMLEQATLHGRTVATLGGRPDTAGIALGNYETVRLDLKNCQADIENQHEAVRLLGRAYDACINKHPVPRPAPRGHATAITNRQTNTGETLRHKLDTLH